VLLHGLWILQGDSGEEGSHVHGLGVEHGIHEGVVLRGHEGPSLLASDLMVQERSGQDGGRRDLKEEVVKVRAVVGGAGGSGHPNEDLRGDESCAQVGIKVAVTELGVQFLWGGG
jgi:hypothetical protein